MTRSLVVLCTLAIGATGCSYFQPQTLPQGLPQTWTRADGQPIDSAQLEADKTACRGEMDQANAALGTHYVGASRVGASHSASLATEAAENRSPSDVL